MKKIQGFAVLAWTAMGLPALALTAIAPVGSKPGPAGEGYGLRDQYSQTASAKAAKSGAAARHRKPKKPAAASSDAPPSASAPMNATSSTGANGKMNGQ